MIGRLLKNTYYSNPHKAKVENLNSAVLMKEIECLKITIYIFKFIRKKSVPGGC